MDESLDLNLKMQLVKKQPLFSQLTDAETEELAGLFSEQRVAPEETIVKEGDLVDSVYLIVRGTADVRHVSIKDNKREVTSIATMREGEAIGLSETGFYSISGRRMATVVAVTDMVLLRLSVASFHGFALSHTHVSDILHKHAEKVPLNDKQ